MNFHRGEISTLKKINLKKAYKILQTPFFQKIILKSVTVSSRISYINNEYSY